MFQQHYCESFCGLLCGVPRLIHAIGRGWWGEFSFPLLLCQLYGALVSSIVFGSCQFLFTTFSDGCLGSNNDEGRSEVR